MSPYYAKPAQGERLLIFGDGDVAIFDSIASSPSVEGHYHIKLRPTPQMRWRKQIPEIHFNENDRWIHKIYKKELCLQLSFDPDFPTWVILCDYNAREDTPMMESLIRCVNLINRNRELEKDKNIAISELNSLKKRLRKKAQHMTEDEIEKLAFAQMVLKTRGTSYQNEQQQPNQQA